jgi:DNA-binding transcriptional LysR family regulator
MEIRDLRVYLAVVESGSFTRATAHVHLVQSAVSDAVARLERELGLQLLERRRSGVRPTPAGDALARWARLLTSSADRAAREIAGLRTGAAGTLWVGLLPTITPFVLPPLLRSLRGRPGGLDVRVREGLAPDLFDRVRSGELDLAIVFFPAAEAAGLELVEVAPRPLSLLVAGGHPLSSRRRVALAAAASEGWVTYPPHNPGRLWLEEACRLAGFTPRIAAEVETAMQQEIFVGAGMGVAMVPFARGRAQSPPGLARLVALRPPLPEFRIGYAFDAGTTNPAVAPARRAVEEILRAA